MKYDISISISANTDFFQICENLKEYGRNAIDIFAGSFDKFIDNVTDMPLMYPQYRNTKYRKAGIEYGYIIFYKINKKEKSINVSRILHGKRNIDNLLT
jgi:plasmid stabilization system protein ParE